MIFKKVFFCLCLSVLLSSCQFTETLILNEDGSGNMAVEMDLSEMMAFAGAASEDSLATKMDTIISMKEFLLDKKDSIASLPMEEQERLRLMENYDIHVVMDTETSKMWFQVNSNFTNIEEANELLAGLEKSAAMIPGATNGAGDTDSNNILGVSYSFKHGTFKRDAFIKDTEKHRQQLDSLKSGEDFLNGVLYTLKYTFPRKIERASIEDATYSSDGKTIVIERRFMDYFKDPDVLDLEVILEK